MTTRRPPTPKRRKAAPREPRRESAKRTTEAASGGAKSRLDDDSIRALVNADLDQLEEQAERAVQQLCARIEESVGEQVSREQNLKLRAETGRASERALQRARSFDLLALVRPASRDQPTDGGAAARQRFLVQQAFEELIRLDLPVHAFCVVTAKLDIQQIDNALVLLAAGADVTPKSRREHALEVLRSTPPGQRAVLWVAAVLSFGTDRDLLEVLLDGVTRQRPNRREGARNAALLRNATGVLTRVAAARRRLAQGDFGGALVTVSFLVSQAWKGFEKNADEWLRTPYDRHQVPYSSSLVATAALLSESGRSDREVARIIGARMGWNPRATESFRRRGMRTIRHRLEAQRGERFLLASLRHSAWSLPELEPWPFERDQ